MSFTLLDEAKLAALLQDKAEKDSVVDAYLHTISLKNVETSGGIGSETRGAVPGELAVGAILKDISLEGTFGHNNAPKLASGEGKKLALPQKTGGTTLKLSPAKKVVIPKKESPRKASPVKQEKKEQPVTSRGQQEASTRKQQKIGFAI